MSVQCAAVSCVNPVQSDSAWHRTLMSLWQPRLWRRSGQAKGPLLHCNEPLCGPWGKDTGRKLAENHAEGAVYSCLGGVSGCRVDAQAGPGVIVCLQLTYVTGMSLRSGSGVSKTQSTQLYGGTGAGTGVFGEDTECWQRAMQRTWCCWGVSGVSCGLPS